MNAVSYSIGVLADLSGVSVRTLHHDDHIGLLPATGRSAAGYREYDDADLDRVHQVLAYRELGFSLDDIARILAGDGPDESVHLRRQHGLVRARIARLEAMLVHLEQVMEARSMGISLTPQEQFEIFGPDHPLQAYDREAEQRWGDTDAWRQSRRRTAAYSADDWRAIKADAGAIEAGFVAALADGTPADGERAMDLAQAHREHISRWFYDVPVPMHRGLADMYLADPRFAQHYEDLAPGLAVYVRDAMHANADRA